MLVSNGTGSTRSTTIASNLSEYIVKSDKSASQIRNPRFQIGRTVMTQFENREFWFARNIPLLAEEGRLRDELVKLKLSHYQRTRPITDFGSRI